MPGFKITHIKFLTNCGAAHEHGAGLVLKKGTNAPHFYCAFGKVEYLYPISRREIARADGWRELPKPHDYVVGQHILIMPRNDEKVFLISSSGEKGELDFANGKLIGSIHGCLSAFRQNQVLTRQVGQDDANWAVEVAERLTRFLILPEPVGNRDMLKTELFRLANQYGVHPNDGLTLQEILHTILRNTYPTPVS